MYKFIIVPDVHGRTFWKSIIPLLENNTPLEKIVFLGDYLDPYPHENITADTIIPNFKEIIQLKKQYPNKIVLLLGNHDLEYWNNIITPCRCDTKNYNQIQQLFLNNSTLFQLIYINEPFLFSHAGILNKWYNATQIIFNLQNINDLNNLLQENNYHLFTYLNSISVYRGGYDSVGSPVWADAREHLNNPQFENYIQIFAHTQLEYPLKLNDYTYCVDARQLIYIDENNSVKLFNDNSQIKLIKTK